MVKFARRRLRKKKPPAPEGWTSLDDGAGTTISPTIPERTPLKQQPGRVIAVIGPPMVGVSTLCEILHDTCKTPTQVIKGRPDPDQVNSYRKEGTEVIFLDGFPETPEDVQMLFDERMLSGTDGALIRVSADRGAVFRRLEETGVVQGAGFEAMHEGWSVWMARLGPLEERARELSIPCYGVFNEDLLAGLVELSKRSGISL